MEPTTKRRPIRGLLYGLMLGLGLALLVVGQGIAALGTWPPFLVLVGGIIAGTLWSLYGPAKAPKGTPPAAATPEPEPEPEPVPVAAEAPAEAADAVDDAADAVADEVADAGGDADGGD